MTVMRDSTTAKDIPADSDMVMGYVDGRYAWSGEDWGLFPTAVHVRCSVNAFGGEAEVLDVETGDATPQQVPGWVGRMRGSGIARPTIYCNRANLGAVDQALHDASVSVDACALLVATLDGTTVNGTSAHGYAIIGCQDKGTAQTGGHYDESVIYDDTWPGAAVTAPTIHPSEDDKVYLFQRKDGGEQYLSLPAGLFYVGDEGDWSALRAAGAIEVVVSDAFADVLKSHCVNPPA